MTPEATRLTEMENGMSFHKVTTAALVVAIAAGFAVTGVAAQDRGLVHGHGPHGAMSFSGLDLDGDGSVTEAEIAGAAEARLAQADTNGDGALSADELTAQAEARMSAHMAGRITAMIERLDDDGDGMIQPAEMADRGPDPARFLDRFDADGDGAVSAEEFESARGDHDARGHGGGMHGDRHGSRDRG